MVAISSGETWLNGWLANKAGGAANSNVALSTGDSWPTFVGKVLASDTGLLRIETEKTGTVVVLPMHSDFAQRLKDGAREESARLPCSPSWPGSESAEVMVSRLCFVFRYVETSGITGRVVTREGKGRATNSKTFHVLRHCFISSLQTRAHPTSGRSSPVMMTQKTTPTRRTTNCKRCVAQIE